MSSTGTIDAQTQEKPRSFLGWAFITFLLYWLGIIPGLVANIWFLMKANDEKRRTGKPPKGRTLLMMMLSYVAAVTALIVIAGML